MSLVPLTAAVLVSTSLLAASPEDSPRFPNAWDLNGDASFDISDAVFLLNHLFLGSDPPVDGPFCCCRRGCFWDENLGRFVKRDDGVITDLWTGLMWEDVKLSRSFPTWAQVLEYCRGLSVGGYTDWRLPNVREILSLVSYGIPESACDPVFTEVDYSFASTAASTGETNRMVFSVSTAMGHVVLIPTTDPGDYGSWYAYTDVRAVRGGVLPGGASQSPPGDLNGDGAVDISDPIYLLGYLFGGGQPPLKPTCLLATGVTESLVEGDDGDYRLGRPLRYTDNGDGTITDLNTGLIWQKTPSEILVLELHDAQTHMLEFASGLPELAWRLPFMEELQTIVDYGRSSPACDPVFEFREGQMDFLSWNNCLRCPLIPGVPFGPWHVDFTHGENFFLVDYETPRLSVRLVYDPLNYQH